MPYPVKNTFISFHSSPSERSRSSSMPDILSVPMPETPTAPLSQFSQLSEENLRSHEQSMSMVPVPTDTLEMAPRAVTTSANAFNVDVVDPNWTIVAKAARASARARLARAPPRYRARVRAPFQTTARACARPF